MQKVLIAVDGSDVSQRAVERIAMMTGWLKERPEIHLITVHPPVPYGSRVSGVIGKEALEKYYSEEEAEALKGACSVLDKAGLPYTKHTAVGDLAGKIVEAAQKLGVDLLCMGTHGRGKVGSMVVGSVAQKVLHLSPIPVLLVK